VLKRVIVQFFDDAKILFQADFGAKSSSRQILAQKFSSRQIVAHKSSSSRFWHKSGQSFDGYWGVTGSEAEYIQRGGIFELIAYLPIIYTRSLGAPPGPDF